MNIYTSLYTNLGKAIIGILFYILITGIIGIIITCAIGDNITTFDDIDYKMLWILGALFVGVCIFFNINM